MLAQDYEVNFLGCPGGFSAGGTGGSTEQVCKDSLEGVKENYCYNYENGNCYGYGSQAGLDCTGKTFTDLGGVICVSPCADGFSLDTSSEPYMCIEQAPDCPTEPIETYWNPYTEQCEEYQECDNTPLLGDRLDPFTQECACPPDEEELINPFGPDFCALPCPDQLIRDPLTLDCLAGCRDGYTWNVVSGECDDNCPNSNEIWDISKEQCVNDDCSHTQVLGDVKNTNNECACPTGTEIQQIGDGIFLCQRPQDVPYVPP